MQFLESHRKIPEEGRLVETLSQGFLAVCVSQLGRNLLKAELRSRIFGEPG